MFELTVPDLYTVLNLSVVQLKVIGVILITERDDLNKVDSEIYQGAVKEIDIPKVH